MSLLRVDPDRFAALMKANRTNALAISRVLDMDDDAVRSLASEAYPLLSQVADRLGLNPILLVTMKAGTMVVDGDRIMSALKDMGMSRNELAVEFGVHKNTLYNLCNYQFPKLNRIARAMGNVSPMALLRVDA